MLLFRGIGVAFVHVPKTSGKALRSFLSESVGASDEFWGIGPTDPSAPEGRFFDTIDRAHYTAEMIHDLYDGLLAGLRGMRVFSVARDPYKRALSSYRQFCGFFGDNGFAGRVRTFMDYLRCVRDEMYRTERDGYLYIHGVPQVKFHLPHHTLIHGEDLSEQLSDLFGRRLVFRSTERPNRPLYPSEMKMVERVYAEDFEMWERLTSA